MSPPAEAYARGEYDMDGVLRLQPEGVGGTIGIRLVGKGMFIRLSLQLSRIVFPHPEPSRKLRSGY